MSLKNLDINSRLIREIAIILIIKVALLLTIKHIWFDAPTIPKILTIGSPSILQAITLPTLRRHVDDF